MSGNYANPIWKKGYHNSQHCRKMAFVNKYKPPPIKKNMYSEAGSLKTSIEGLNHVLNSRKGFVYNLLWFLVLSFSTLTCFYQIYDRFSFFSSRPIDTRVTLTRNTSVKFPSITLCPGINNYMPLVGMRHQRAIEAGIKHFCQVNVFQLLNDTFNISTIWDLMSFNGTLAMAAIISRSSILNIQNLFADLPALSPDIVTKTMLGSCFTYSFKELVRFRKDDFNVLFRLNYMLPFCSSSTDAMFMLHNDDDIINYKITTGFRTHKPNSNIIYGLSATRFKVLNRLEQPCATNKVVNECEKNCVEKALKNIIHCRLPFTSIFELPLCTNTSSAYDAFLKIIKTAFTFDYVKKCNCTKICDEILYSDNLKLTESLHGSFLSFYFDNNVIEEIEEYYSYTVIPFICDVGGNLGLFLGLSIPAMFHLVESFVAYSFKKSITN